MGKLRLGIIVDGMQLPAWQLHAIRSIVSSDHTEVVSCRVVTPSAQRGGLLSLYKRYDDRKMLKNPEAIAPADASSLLAAIPATATEIDVLLNFTDKNIDVTPFPRYGIWSLFFGSATTNAEAGLPEVMYNQPVIRSGLKLKADGNEKIIYHSYSLVDPNSVKLTMNRCYWKSAAFAERMLRSLHNDPTQFANIDLPGQTTQASIPDLSIATRFISKTASRIINRLKRGSSRKDWILMYKDNATPGESIDLSQFKKLEAPQGFFWADPIVVEHNGKPYIFIEEYVYATGRGRISVLERNDDGSFKDAVTILEKPYHLSYPFVFQVAGKYYMIPESSENKTIDLYECTSFPGEWKFVRSLMNDVVAVDSTMLQYNGKWWLFTNIENTPGASSLDELHIFYCDDIINSELIAHPHNPVISDVRRARPAGPLQVISGSLYRPSQVCAPYYGWGISIHRVTKLSETQYEEQPGTLIQPDISHGLHGVHTLACAGSFCIVDAIATLKK